MANENIASIQKGEGILQMESFEVGGEYLTTSQSHIAAQTAATRILAYIASINPHDPIFVNGRLFKSAVSENSNSDVDTLKDFFPILKTAYSELFEIQKAQLQAIVEELDRTKNGEKSLYPNDQALFRAQAPNYQEWFLYQYEIICHFLDTFKTANGDQLIDILIPYFKDMQFADNVSAREFIIGNYLTEFVLFVNSMLLENIENEKSLCADKKLFVIAAQTEINNETLACLKTTRDADFAYRKKAIEKQKARWPELDPESQSKELTENNIIYNVFLQELKRYWDKEIPAPEKIEQPLQHYKTNLPNRISYFAFEVAAECFNDSNNSFNADKALVVFKKEPFIDLIKELTSLGIDCQEYLKSKIYQLALQIAQKAAHQPLSAVKDLATAQKESEETEQAAAKQAAQERQEFVADMKALLEHAGLEFKFEQNLYYITDSDTKKCETSLEKKEIIREEATRFVNIIINDEQSYLLGKAPCAKRKEHLLTEYKAAITQDKENQLDFRRSFVQQLWDMLEKIFNKKPSAPTPATTSLNSTTKKQAPATMTYTKTFDADMLHHGLLDVEAYSASYSRAFESAKAPEPAKSGQIFRSFLQRANSKLTPPSPQRTTCMDSNFCRH